MEMSRQRLRTGVLEASTRACPHCEGTGLVRTASSAGLSALRLLEEEAGRGRGSIVTLRASQEGAFYVLNNKRRELDEIETRYGVTIVILPDGEVEGARMSVEASGPRPTTQVSYAPLVDNDVEYDEDEIEEEEDEIEDEPVTQQSRGERAERSERPERGDDGGRKRKRRRRGRRGPRDEETRGPDSDGETDEAGSFEEGDEAEGESREAGDGSEALGPDGQPRRSRRGRRGGRRRRGGGDKAPGGKCRGRRCGRRAGARGL